MLKLAFFHLPKTGGTSLDSALRSILSVSPPFYPNDPLSAGKVAELDGFDVVSGHLSYVDFAAHFSARQAITIMRDPVDRCLSWYWFCRNQVKDAGEWERITAAKTLSPEDYFRLPDAVIFHNCVNSQSRQLGGHRGAFEDDPTAVFDQARRMLDRMLWIGFTESLQADVAQLRSSPGFERLPALARLNSAVWDNPPSSSLREQIAARNKLDVLLYEHALGLTGHLA